MRSTTHALATLLFVGITTVGVAACFSEATAPEEANEDSLNASEIAVENPSDESCEALDAWARANKDRLPRSYDGLARYSVRHRKAIFAVLSSEQQSELWKEHLHRYIDSHRDMPSTQVEALRQVTANISPDLFRGNDRRARVIELMKPVGETLDQEQARAIFGNLGPADPAMPSTASDSTSALLVPPDCDCSTVSVYCNGFACVKNKHHCIHSEIGCGSFWTFECNGVCNTD